MAPVPPQQYPQHVEFDFTTVPQKLVLKRDNIVYFGLQVIAADGMTYRDACSLGQDGKFQHRRDPQHIDLTDDLADRMKKLGIKAEVSADKNVLRVTGWPTKDGRPRAVVLGRIWTRCLPPNQLPRVRNPAPPPVEFNLAPIPLEPGEKVALSFEVSPADGVGKPVQVEAEYEHITDRAELAKQVAGRFTKVGLKAEAAGEKVRVIGWLDKDGKFISAAGGTVRSAELGTKSLPSVTGLPPAMPCVVFDFAALPLNPGRTVTIGFEVATAKDGEKFREQLSYMGAFAQTDVSPILYDALIRAGFHAERVGAKVRVYGWVRPGGRLIPVTGGKVECKELKPDQLPKVTNPRKP